MKTLPKSTFFPFTIHYSLFTIFLCLLFSATPVYAGTTINAGMESITSSFTTSKPTTEFYGIGAEFEITENWRISSNLLIASIEGSLSHLSLSLGYKINSDYLFDISPYIFAGIDPFFAQIKDLSEVGVTYHIGLGLNYVFENTLSLSFLTKLYLANPFSDKSFLDEKHNFNTGTLGLSLGIGYKF